MKRFSQELKYISYSSTLYSDEDVKPSCSTSTNTNPTATSSLPKRKSIQSSKEKRATGSSSQKAKKKVQSKGRKAGKAKGRLGGRRRRRRNWWPRKRLLTNLCKRMAVTKLGCTTATSAKVARPKRREGLQFARQPKLH